MIFNLDILNNKVCSVRKDLIDNDTLIPIGDIYVSPFELLKVKYRWNKDVFKVREDIFQIRYEGRWYDAQSIDFEF